MTQTSATQLTRPEDAMFVNRFGHYVRGVDEIVALHIPIHETVYRESTLENELIDVTRTLAGIRTDRNPASTEQKGSAPLS